MVSFMIKEFIVVEGIHDKQKIEGIYNDASIIMTNGSEISNETLRLIKKASSINGVILFLDPDGPGDLIRKKIEQHVPNVKHAFLKKEKAISPNGKKIGIEHATDADIKEALENIYTKNCNEIGSILMSDLVDLCLVGKRNSNKLRNEVASNFNIGITNGKTFLRRINEFNISLDEIRKIVEEGSN